MRKQKTSIRGQGSSSRPIKRRFSGSVCLSTVLPELGLDLALPAPPLLTGRSPESSVNSYVNWPGRLVDEHSVPDKRQVPIHCPARHVTEPLKVFLISLSFPFRKARAPVLPVQALPLKNREGEVFRLTVVIPTRHSGFRPDHYILTYIGVLASGPPTLQLRHGGPNANLRQVTYDTRTSALRN